MTGRTARSAVRPLLYHVALVRESVILHVSFLIQSLSDSTDALGLCAQPTTPNFAIAAPSPTVADRAAPFANLKAPFIARERLYELGISCAEELDALLTMANHFAGSKQPIFIVSRHRDQRASCSVSRCSGCIRLPANCAFAPTIEGTGANEEHYFVCNVEFYFPRTKGTPRNSESFLRLLRRRYGLYHRPNQSDRSFAHKERKAWRAFLKLLLRAAKVLDIQVPPLLEDSQLSPIPLPLPLPLPLRLHIVTPAAVNTLPAQDSVTNHCVSLN